MAQKRKRNKKWMYWLAMLVLLVVAGVIVYLVWDNYFNDKKDDKGREEEVGQIESVSAQEEEIKKSDPESSEKPKAIQYDGEDPNTKEELSGAITYTGVSGDKLMIRVNIAQYLEDGECTLSLIRSGSTIYSNSAGIVANASTATCEGFDVLVDGIGGGTMEILINLNAGGKNGTIRGEVNV